MSRFRLCAMLAAGAVLAACAALPPPGAPAQRAAAFDLMGRVAVTHDGRAFSSGVRWQHLAGRDEIWLLTPVGQTLAHIEADATGATLTAADGKQHRAGDAGSLTREALGWELPLEHLSWWVRGEILPGGVIGEVVRDQQGRLVRLRQDGWQITLTHSPANGPAALPQRLELARDAHRIRLVIDGWRQESQ
ncbi:MAG: outer membrane lipoprotein LolB [Betaproteobacteria bacterium RIFCSPLOWO2_02_FULL_67_26]|nr:MAG: outer membrane lipoprotein LolB [Betaproteobacteria bacterium RIFCSPLOWO2_02_FULL_67_26]